MLNPIVINECLTTDPRFSARAKTQTREERNFSMVLKFHPILAKGGLLKIATDTLDMYRYDVENVLGSRCNVRIGWSNYGPHLRIKMRNISCKNHAAAPKGGG